MKQFTLVLIDGTIKNTTGHNVLDALWRAGSTSADIKTIASYQEGSGPMTRFAH
jgi:hypothetical protein